MESDGDGSKVQMLLKECSQSVGVFGRPAVVLVHERISDSLMADVCAFMKYGMHSQFKVLNKVLGNFRIC